MDQQQLKFEKHKSDNLDQLLGLIEKGAPFLTVNARLTQYIRSAYDRAMRDRGRVMWDTPAVLPLASWLDNLRESSRQERPLISDARLMALWETVVLVDPIFKEGEVLMPQGVVKTALDAYRLMNEYRLSLPEDEIYLSEEALCLKRWVAAYREKLGKLGFIDRTDVYEIALRFIRDRGYAPDKEIVLAGFDEITPNIKRIISAIEDAGSEIVFWPLEPFGSIGFAGPPAANADITIRCYADEVEEVVQAARWVRKGYREGKTTGIIVTELNRYRKIIKREFEAELDPASVIPWEGAGDLFNMSLGNVLYDEPLVRFALDLLSVDSRKIDINKTGLLSPFIARSKEERFQLARLDADLKKKNITRISLLEIRAALINGDYAAGSFLESLEIWIGVLRGKGRKLPGEWAEEFHHLLNKISWSAREETISSAEYQALASWRDLLFEFAGLDDIVGRIVRADAVARLVRMAKEKIFQTEKGESRIEVMGLLEASGMEFDRIWIMGAHEDLLPGEPSPNPFIPVDLQKRHNLPHSSYERELNFSKALISRVIMSAPSVEVSWPKKVEDKEVKLSPLIPSPLASSCGEEPGGAILFTDSSRFKDAVFESASVEPLPDEDDIPVTDAESAYIRGGSNILKNQSACPFRAFAVHRLSAEAVAEPEPGITGLERGDLAHIAMKLFWEEVKNSDRLAELIESARIAETARRSVGASVKAWPSARSKEGRFLELEKERLEALIMEWAGVESKRGCFQTEGTESGVGLSVAGLDMNCRIDRLDSLASGERIIIDYKTGEADTGSWLTDRPEEPQLMLYSMTGSYDGVAFARLKRGECRFAGITRGENMLPDVKPFGADRFSAKLVAEGHQKNIGSWSELMDLWRRTVTRLAGDFMSGDAKVDPRDPGSENSACKYCQHMALCRVFEREAVSS